MGTFHIMLECGPWLAFVGFGLSFLLTALVPPSRDRNWNLWNLYLLGDFQPTFLAPFFEQLRFIKRKPIAEEYLDEESAVRLTYIVAAIFLFSGIGGLVLIVHRSIP